MLLQSSGCLFHPTPRTRLACLRTKTEGELARAVTAVWQQTHWRRPFDRVQDEYFHIGTPSEAVRAGRIGVVPILAGMWFALPAQWFELKKIVLNGRTLRQCP